MPPDNHRLERIACFTLGFILIVIILIVIVLKPEPTHAQFFVFRTVIAIAVAGIAALIPGALNFNVNKYIKASGAIGVFAIIYTVNPPSLITPVDFSITDDIRRADIAYSEGNYSAACTFYESAIKNNSKNWIPYQGLGKTYYKESKFNFALESFIKAFELNDKKDGAIAYSIALTYDAIGDTKNCLSYLNLAQPLLTKSELLDDVIFDKGLMHLILLITSDPTDTESQYSASLSMFKNFIERGGSPDHWAHYHLACLYAIKSAATNLDVREKKSYYDMAKAEIIYVADKIKDFKGSKAEQQRNIFKNIILNSTEYKRAGGGPVCCKQLIDIVRKEESLKAKISSI